MEKETQLQQNNVSAVVMSDCWWANYTIHCRHKLTLRDANRSAKRRMCSGQTKSTTTTATTRTTTRTNTRSTTNTSNQTTTSNKQQPSNQATNLHVYSIHKPRRKSEASGGRVPKVGNKNLGFSGSKSKSSLVDMALGVGLLRLEKMNCLKTWKQGESWSLLQKHNMKL